MIDLRLDPDTLEPLQVPLERLYRQHDARVRTKLRRTLGGNIDNERIDDALAFAWCQAAKCLPSLRFDDAGAWLFVVARNEVFRVLAAERRAQATDDETLYDLVGTHDPDVVEQLHARAECAHVLAGLIPNQRRALVARSLGLSYAQIADAIGESTTHVNRHLTEGRARAWKERLAA